MSQKKKRFLPPEGEDFSDDSFESLGEDIVPHAMSTLASGAILKKEKSPAAAASFATAGAPLSTETFMEVPQLKTKRRREGILPDDGSERREDMDGAAVRALYGSQWLDEAIARQKILDANPHYRFAFTVAGGHNSVLKTFIKESEISREARTRVNEAIKALVEKRRTQQDTSGEQARAQALRTQIDKLHAESQALETSWQALDHARKCLKQALNSLTTPNKFRLILDAPNTRRVYQDIFDRTTRSLVARFGASGFEFGADLFKTVLQEFNVAALAAPPAGHDPLIVLRVKNDTPNASLLALYWTTLMAVFNNAGLLEVIGARKLFPDKSAYGQNPELYAKDLRALGTIVFTADAATPATNNLLLFDEITVYLWRMINLMLERSAADVKPLSRPTLLARPPAKRTVIVNNIEITLDVADEDLVSSISGQEVFGVDRDKLAEMRSRPYNNIDQPRTSALMTALLEPMFNAVWSSLFYTKRTLDKGLDDESFAGGYYANGRVMELFKSLPAPNAKSAQGSIIGLAVIAIEMFNSCFIKQQNNITAGTRFDGRTFAAAAFTQFDAKPPAGVTAFRDGFKQRFDVSTDSKTRYNADILNRYLRREKVLACLAQAVLLKRRFGLSQGLPDADFAALQAYVDAMNTTPPGTPGSRSKDDFATREDAAMRVFENSLVTTAATDIDDDQPPYVLLLVLALSPAQFSFIGDALANSAARAQFEATKALIDERLAQLREQEALINARITEWLRMNVTDEKATLAKIITEGVGGNAENNLSPINTGYLFFTELYTDALMEAFKWIEDFIPCLARQYTSNDLIESEYYQSRYSILVKAHLRLVDAQMPHTWRANATEMRSKTQIASAGESLRAWVAKDPGINHIPGCDDGVGDTAHFLASAGQYRLVEQMQMYPLGAAGAPYPLAPSLRVPRGAF